MAMAMAMAMASDPARQVNEILLEGGYSQALIDWWWLELAQPALEGRTALKAWRQGEDQQVLDLARRYAAKGDEMRQWLDEARAEVANGSMAQRVAAQKAPGDLLDQWRARRTAS